MIWITITAHSKAVNIFDGFFGIWKNQLLVQNS